MVPAVSFLTLAFPKVGRSSLAVASRNKRRLISPPELATAAHIGSTFPLCPRAAIVFLIMIIPSSLKPVRPATTAPLSKVLAIRITPTVREYVICQRPVLVRPIMNGKLTKTARKAASARPATQPPAAAIRNLFPCRFTARPTNVLLTANASPTRPHPKRVVRLDNSGAAQSVLLPKSVRRATTRIKTANAKRASTNPAAVRRSFRQLAKVQK